MVESDVKDRKMLGGLVVLVCLEGGGLKVDAIGSGAEVEGPSL